MKTALSKHKITNELFYIAFVCHIILKRMKRLDYAVSNKKMEYDLAEEIARDSSIGPI